MKLPDRKLETEFIDNTRMYWCEFPMVFNNYVVKARFLSDGFSIPKPAQSIFSKAPKYIYPAFLHDELHRKDSTYPSVTRKEADKLLVLYMKLYDLKDLKEIFGKWNRFKHRVKTTLKRRAVYVAIRAGGRKSWKKKYSNYYSL